MRLSDLASVGNLELAWRRIATGTNHQYKRFFRQLYYAYELALSENLRDLRTRLLARAWQPHLPDRIYVPKASGLHRPLTLLHLEDQIVLQAFANIVAHKLLPKRRPFVMHTVFSNVLTSRRSIFFFREWQRTYAAFQRRVKHLFQNGLRWVADFDLAAFYETISHELLLRTAYTRVQDTDDVLWMRSCLRTWSAARITSSKGHGVPQGPIASDLLAEMFLLPIDRAMTGITGYVRYVDDVRLFAKTESELRSATIALEVQCRERGLIPQTGKFMIRKAQSLSEALGMLPSISEPGKSTRSPRLSARTAQRLIKSAVGGRPLRVIDKTRLRHVLYRADESPHLLRLVCKLLPRHPEHVDAFVAFLTQYGYRKSVRDCCLRAITVTPYDFVKGEIWHILARYYSDSRSFSVAVRRQLIDEAIRTLKRRAGTSLKWGAGHFLCTAERVDGWRYSKFLTRQSRNQTG